MAMIFLEDPVQAPRILHDEAAPTVLRVTLLDARCRA
jgi:hypothetical protein